MILNGDICNTKILQSINRKKKKKKQHKLLLRLLQDLHNLQDIEHNLQEQVQKISKSKLKTWKT